MKSLNSYVSCRSKNEDKDALLFRCWEKVLSCSIFYFSSLILEIGLSEHSVTRTTRLLWHTVCWPNWCQGLLRADFLQGTGSRKVSPGTWFVLYFSITFSVLGECCQQISPWDLQAWHLAIWCENHPSSLRQMGLLVQGDLLFQQPLNMEQISVYWVGISSHFLKEGLEILIAPKGILQTLSKLLVATMLPPMYSTLVTLKTQVRSFILTLWGLELPIKEFSGPKEAMYQN